MLTPSEHLSVADLWPLAFPADVRLVGGEAGLQRVVEWVTSLRASFPLFPDLTEGHLALASPQVALALDPRLTLSYLIQELAHAQAAGLLVDEEPTEAEAALADDLALPIFVAPPGADLRALEREALRALVDREAQLARREAEARQRYQGLFAAGGVQAVLADLAVALQADAYVKDAEGALVEHAEAPAPRDGHVGPRPNEAETSVFSIRIAGRHLGELVIQRAGTLYASLVPILGRQAAEVCGLEMLQRATRHEAEEQFGADLVEELLATDRDDVRVASRLMRLGYDLSPGRRHVVVALGGREAKTLSAIGETLARDLAWIAGRESASALGMAYREHYLCLLSFDSAAGERRVRYWVQELVSRLPGPCCDLGVSRVSADLAGLAAGVEQSVAAWSLGRRIAGRLSPFYWEDLGLYRLLAGLRDQADLRRFYDETLGVLVAYDAAHNTDLVPTLEAFFEQNANASQTARALYVHRNTLNYRLQRIAEITGLDLDDAEARLALQLALKVRRLGT